MNINDFQNLSREEQFKTAGSIAGIEPSVFDGLWRTESGRGANMLGPVTRSGDRAEGHYQLMPKTRATMEGRFGSAIDPYNFGQSLFAAAHLMKENMGKFKNVPDSLRAYNGGWNPATWGNKETAAYAGKVLGNDDSEEPIDSVGSTTDVQDMAEGFPSLPAQSAYDLWNTPFTRAVKPDKAGKPSKLTKAMADVMPALSGPMGTASTTMFGTATDMAGAATTKETKAKDDAGIIQMAQGAAFHEPITSTLRWAMRDDEPVDAGYVPDEKMMQGKTENEQSDLRSATSLKQANRMLFDQQEGKDANELAFRNGTLWGIGATLIAELPGAIISGGIVSLGAKVAGVGATTLAAQGRLSAAIASSTAEGIIGNVATTALLDSIGERQGATAYAMGVAGGLLTPALMARGLGRAAERAATQAGASRIAQDMLAAEKALMERATASMPVGAVPAEVRVKMDALEAEDARAAIASHKAAVPEGRKMVVGDEADIPVGLPVKVAPEAKAAVEAEDAAVLAKVESGARVIAVEQAGLPPVAPAATVVIDTLPKLPSGLDGAKPRYAYGDKKFTIEFADDVDRAAYIVAQEKPSKGNDKYMAWLTETTGWTPEQAVAHGKIVRDTIKATAKDAEPGAIKFAAGTRDAVKATPEEVAIREAAVVDPLAAQAVDEMLPTPKEAPVPTVVPTPVMPLADVPVKAKAKGGAKQPKLGKTKGQGELYPLTPADKKAIADLRAKANATAMEEVPVPKAAGQGELDFTAEPKGRGRADTSVPINTSPELAMVDAINGKSLLEVAAWAVQNSPPELAVIAQRALAQIRHLSDNGLIIGKLEVTQPGMAMRGGRGMATMSNTAGIGNGPSTVSIKLNHPSNGVQSGVIPEVIVHELFHAATMASIRLGNLAAAADTAVGKATKDLYAVHNALIKHFNARVKSGLDLSEFEQAVFARNNNAMADVNESLTWALTNKPMQDYLETIPYKAGTLWSEFVKGVRSLLGMSPSQDTMLSEYLRIGDELTSRAPTDLKAVENVTAKQFSTNNGFGPVMPPALAAEVAAFLNDPVVMKHGLDRMPMATPAERAEAKQILALYRKADAPEYVVDESRLSWLLKHAPAFSPTSNIMLRSKNPVVRMAALELLENGGGAGGRRSTASIAKYMNERAIVGNSIVDMERSFQGWFKTQPGASNLNEALTGMKKSEFSRLVAEEIEQRRYPTAKADLGASVREAADSVEQSFERARLMQVEAKTVGWAALPDTSTGYMPHRIKSHTYRGLSDSKVRALHGELTEQFINGSGFDPSFADQLASRYLDRVSARALGGFDSPMGLHQVGAADVIREALEAAQMTRPEIDAVMKRYAAGGAGHTKKRLNLDLRKEITADDGSTFKLMDLYDTDMLSLVRGQSQRVSGEVALARHGVMGKPGLAIMRRAMGYGGQAEKVRVDGQEIGAFDQVASEFIGGPFGVSNKNVDRALQLNSLMSLGGMGFNQLAELINAGMTLGVKAAFQNVTGFGRLRAEILALSKGKPVSGSVLTHLEQFGGAEFGTDAYKMVFPLDNPELFANSMGTDTLHATDRILRGAGHLQSKLSLWRSIHSVQVRGVAEQIVMKAARAMKDGVNDYHLRDMGMSDDMFARLKADMPNIAKYQGGKLVEFDITKATDKEAAYAFTQGVHRGASQIIQGTFIGETGKYAHNSWLRMMTQFRSFSLTAIDKQFNRQVGNRGVMGALFMTMGAMGVAAPIYMARTYLASVGRADQDEYLEKHLSYGSIARSTTNYIATSGLAGDFLDAFTAVTGTSEATGGRSGSNTQFIGNMIAPVAGKVDKLWGAVQNTKDGTDVHGLLRELPLSRLPWFIPAINSLGD